MAKENWVSKVGQKDAPAMFGTHFIDVVPYRDYHPALKYFFLSLPKNKESLHILDAACGNEKRIIDGLRTVNSPIELVAADLVPPLDLAEPPTNVSREFQNVNLSQKWPFPDNSFDGIMFMWALHWFGLEGSQNALDNLARVLKPGASAIISTLTPFDVTLKRQVFLREKISKNALKKIYPKARVIGDHRGTIARWTVNNDREVVEQMQLGKGYYIKRGHLLSIIGEKEVIGFTPEYFGSELSRRGLEIVMAVNKPSEFDNKYPATLPEGRSQLIYVVRKQSKS